MAGGLEGVRGPVVLAGLPDDRVAVVLAAVVDGHSDPQGQGGLPLPDRLTAVAAALVGGNPELGIQPVEGPLALADGSRESSGWMWVNSLVRRVWSWRWRASRSPPKPPAI